MTISVVDALSLLNSSDPLSKAELVNLAMGLCFTFPTYQKHQKIEEGGSDKLLVWLTDSFWQNNIGHKMVNPDENGWSI